MQWQSTLAWLKNPPPSYKLPPVDIEASLNKISATTAAGGYASEYDFQLAILEMTAAAHDGHFSYVGDVFKVFNFENKLAADIVSVSVDGVTAPKLYRLCKFGPNLVPQAGETCPAGALLIYMLLLTQPCPSFFTT